MKREGMHGNESKNSRIIQPAPKGNAKPPTTKVLPPSPSAGTAASAAAKTLLPSSELSKRPKSAALKGRSNPDRPVSKSRGKVKGARKLKSSDVLLNHRLLAWRQVAGGGSFPAHCGELSASRILDHLYANSTGQEEEEELEDYNGGNGEQESSLGTEFAKAADGEEEAAADEEGGEDWFMVERPSEA